MPLLDIPADLGHAYDTLLERKAIPSYRRPHYKKWLRYYLDFCQKYGFSPVESQSLSSSMTN